MTDRAVAQRYAEAFVNALGGVSGAASDSRSHALEAGSPLETGLEELKSVTQTYEGSRDLERFLGSPEIGPEEKERLLDRLWSSGVSKELMGLLRLLLRRDRIEELPAVAEEAVAVAEERQGIVRGRVVTAHPISSAETEQVARRVGRLLGKQVVLQRSVDPGILGGIRVIVGTNILDGSVKTRLEEMRRQLLEVKVG